MIRLFKTIYRYSQLHCLYNISKAIADVDTSFDTSIFELHGPLSKLKNKMVIGLMKAESGEKIVKHFVGSRFLKLAI